MKQTIIQAFDDLDWKQSQREGTMGHQIIKQPDGYLAVFSSVVDDWIIRDANQQELEDYYAGDAARKAREDTRRICEAVLAGNARSVYYQFAMTFDEANKTAQWRAGVAPPGDDGS